MFWYIIVCMLFKSKVIILGVIYVTTFRYKWAIRKYNHPLAGKNLIFTVTVVSIV